MRQRKKNFSQQKYGNIDVFVKDPLTNPINQEAVFSRLSSVLPDHFLDLVDIVYVGKFPFLDDNSVNATYAEGAIYTSNDQDDEQDMLDDIVHEFAHALEEKANYDIYSDSKIENEFLSKRGKLEILLNYENHDTTELNFLNTEFDRNLDFYFFHEVGYDKLANLSMGVFLSPYSITSLREYFSIGFEEYYLGSRSELKKISPSVYEKISLLSDPDWKNKNF